MDTIGKRIEEYLQEMEERITQKVIQTLKEEVPVEGNRTWMNKKELAVYLGVCYKTLSAFLKKNPSFPSSNIANTIRYNPNHVDEWMEINRESGKIKQSMWEKSHGKGSQND